MIRLSSTVNTRYWMPLYSTMVGSGRQKPLVSSCFSYLINTLWSSDSNSITYLCTLTDASPDASLSFKPAAIVFSNPGGYSSDLTDSTYESMIFRTMRTLLFSFYSEKKNTVLF